ncbi:MAG: copper homeostasis protein CutC [Gemmataceae bacterium]|nr:NAD(P)-binding protein [Gemmata sp.]MDW8197145.1 copper homeostasis protein CutC [Gemmataceae bacterium]
MSDPLRVAIVGGGLTGLVLAHELRHQGIAVTLFDTRFPLGGRIDTRTIPVPGIGPVTFDLGCLYLHPLGPGAPDPLVHRLQPAPLPPALNPGGQAGAGVAPHGWIRPHARVPSSSPHGLPALDFLNSVPLDSQEWHPVPVVFVTHQDYLHGYALFYPQQGGSSRLLDHLRHCGYDEYRQFYTQTEVIALEERNGRWRLRTRYPRPDGSGWESGDTFLADALVLTQPVPQALELLDASGFILPDGLRDELLRVTFAPSLTLLAVTPAPTRMLEPVMYFHTHSPVELLADHQAMGTSTHGPALTAQASPQWCRDYWDLPDSEITATLLAAINPWLTERPIWYQLVRRRYAYCQSPLNLPFAQLTQPPLFFAGDSFAAYAGHGINRAYTSAIYTSQRMTRVLSDVMRQRGGRRLSQRCRLEVVVTTPEEARTAVTRGANRLLLCSALELGGLTPSLACFRAVRQTTQEATHHGHIPITVMIRPRGGGFCYTDDEFDRMQAEAKQFLEEGADGIAFGILKYSPSSLRQAHNPGRVTIDLDRCQLLVQLAKSYGKEAVFHRAFDCLADRRNGLHELIVLGFQRVLTSGGTPLALDGTGVLAADIQFAAWDIDVVPCGGIRTSHLAAIVQHTHCSHIAASFRQAVNDGSFVERPRLAEQMARTVDGYSYTLNGPELMDARNVLDQLPAQGLYGMNDES